MKNQTYQNLNIMVTKTFFTVINERKIIKKLDSQEEIF